MSVRLRSRSVGGRGCDGQGFSGVRRKFGGLKIKDVVRIINTGIIWC